MENHVTNLRICSREQHVTIQAEFGRATVALPMNIAHNIQGDRTRFREEVLKMAMEKFSTPTEGLMEHQLKSFFKEVFGMKIHFPVRSMNLASNSARLFMPDGLTEDAILDAYAKKWHLFCVNENHQPVASWIDQSLEQERWSPSGNGGYYFEVKMNNTPNEKDLGMAFKDMLGKTGLQWVMNLKEYLLASGFMKFLYGNFMDEGGTLTTTSSRVGEEMFVIVHHSSDGGTIYIRKEHMSVNHEHQGPRHVGLYFSDLF